MAAEEYFGPRPNSFPLRVEEFIAKLGDRAEQVFRKITLDMFSRVILMSPVDSGRFIGNWNTTVGEPSLRTWQIKDKSGQLSLDRLNNAVETLKLGDTIYLANNLPYAMRLEYGYSAKAPAGMVRVTVVQFQKMIDEAVRSL
jgi:hypothetical protein